MVSTSQILITVFKFLFMELPIMLLGFIIVPIALLFCKEEDENLPRWARWWDENEYGINGDPYWKTEEHFPEPTNRTYYARLRWLFRNKIGVYSTEVTGIKYEDIDPTTFKTVGDPYVTGYDGTKGNKYCYVTVKLKNGREIYSYFSNRVYNSKILSKFYIRTYMGYKLMDYANIGLLNDPLEKSARWNFEMSKAKDKYNKTVCFWHPFRRIK